MVSATRRAGWLATWTCASVLLASCGGGGGGAAADTTASASGTGPATITVASAPVEVTAERVNTAKAMKHSAALGTLAGATVEVRDAFDKTGTVVYSTTTDANGQFNVELADYQNYAMFLVTVSGGSDLDVNDTGKRDAVPTPSTGQVNALVDPSDLLNGSVRVTLLSDAAYRLIGGDLSRFNASTLNLELKRIAGVLLKKALYSDAAPGSNDLLQFDATSTEHRAALSFDAASMWQPVDAGSSASIVDLYHRGGDVSRAWRTLTAAVPGVQPTLAQEIDKTSAKFQLTVSGTGRVTGELLPGGAVDNTPQPVSVVLPKDGSTVALQAVETDGDWKFDSWVGCSSVSGTRCNVTIDGDVSPIARFAIKVPTIKAEATSLGRLVPTDGITGIRFGDAGAPSTAPTTATIVSRDPATVAFLRSLVPGSLIQTGHPDHPTVRVTAITQPATSVQPTVPSATTAAMTTVGLQVEEATPMDVYDKVSIVVDSAPVAFDEVRAIAVSDGVSGTVRTVLPVPDFTASVVQASVLGSPPSWYVTLATDGRSCHGYGNDSSVRAALQAAWEAAPRAYPFDQPAMAACVALGAFSIEGDLTDYVMGKSMGETDQFAGRHDGTGKLAMNLPRGEPYAPIRTASVGKGSVEQRRGEPVWLAGVGVAVPLGNNMFLASREREAGFRLVAVQDVKSLTTAAAVKRAQADCGNAGLPSACGMLAALDRERHGLRSAGMIPLLSSPLSLTLQKPGTNLSGTVSLNLNIDLSPKAKIDWSIPGTWIRADVGADYTVKPELGLKLAYGATVEKFKVPASSKGRKFNPNNSKAKTSANKIDNSKTLITIDLGRAIPYAGAVLDLSLNLVVGVEVGGEVSVEVTPTLTMQGDFGVHAYYEYHTFKKDDKDISAWFNMPVRQPGISAKLTGTLSVEPYAEVNLAAGLRGVAPQVAKVYVRGGVVFKGEASTGMSYATKFREQALPNVWAEGSVTKTSSKYYESCSLDTRVKSPGSCGCASDKVQKINFVFFTQTVVLDKCVQRGAPVSVAVKPKLIPQRCVDSPELALSVAAHARAGAKISAEHFKWPLNGWLSFIDKDFAFFDKEWPIWEYPAKDNEPETDLTGCKDIT